MFDAKSHDDIPGVTAKHYTVTIISGQSLPKSGSAEGEIIDITLPELFVKLLSTLVRIILAPCVPYMARYIRMYVRT